MRMSRKAVLLILVLGFCNVRAYGQVTAIWTDSSGNYSNAANWSTLAVPINGGGTTYNVVINGTGSDTITYNAGGAAINSLTLGTGETFQDNGLTPGALTNSGTLNWESDSKLTLGGSSFSNSTGTLNVTGLGGLVANGIQSNNGIININNSNLSLNGDYSFTAGSGGGILELQNGSTGKITGGVVSLTTENDSGEFIVDHSSLTVEAGYSMATTIVNGGTLKLGAVGQGSDGAQMILQAGSAVVVAGGFDNGFHGVASIDNSSLVVQGYSGRAMLSNGAILFVNGNASSDFGPSVYDFRVNSGSSVVVKGDFTNFNPLTINDSTFSVKGTFTNNGFFGSGTVTVGPTAILTTANYLQLQVTGPVANLTDVSGTLVANSYQQSGGSTTIESGGLIRAGTFLATGGTVTVNGLLDPTAVEIDSGAALRGTGTIIGNVVMGGTMTPGGNAPGTFTIFGGYEQIENGTFDELIGSSANGLLDVNGLVALDSGAMLDITLLGGFNPIGDTFTILDFSTLDGEFANGSSFVADGYLWDIKYGSHEIDLTASALPEPGSLLLLGAGLLGLCALARRGNRRSVAN